MFYSLEANVGILEARITNVADQIGIHVNDGSVHIPYSENAKTFVPRTEINLRFNAILEEMKQNREYAQEHDTALLIKMDKMEKNLEEMKKILYKWDKTN